MPHSSRSKRPAQGAHLARLRKEAGLSQTELANLVGELQQNIAYWELSDKPPRSDVLIKMAKVLGVQVEDLLTTKPIQRERSGPVGKVQKAFEQVSKLPRRQQEKIVELVNALVEQFQRSAE